MVFANVNLTGPAVLLVLVAAVLSSTAIAASPDSPAHPPATTISADVETLATRPAAGSLTEAAFGDAPAHAVMPNGEVYFHFRAPALIPSFYASNPAASVSFAATAFAGTVKMHLHKCSAPANVVDVAELERFGCNVRPDSQSAIASSTSKCHSHMSAVSTSVSAPVCRASESSTETAGESPCVTHYFVRVEGREGAVFSLTGSIAGVTITPLQAGVPVSGVAETHNFTFYRYSASIPSFTSLLVRGESYGSGDIDLFISLDDKEPSTTHYDYQTTTFDGVALQEITKDDAKFKEHCPNNGKIGSKCPITVGVYGMADVGSTYYLVAYNANDIVTLIPGTPVRTTAAASTTNCYKYVSSKALAHDLQFVVTPISGDPDLFVSPGSVCPSPSKAKWKGISMSVDMVQVPASNCVTGPCSYGVAVIPAGSNPAEYTLLLNDNGTDPNYLLDGTPQVGFLKQGMYDYFFWDILPGYESATILLSPLAGDPVVYINLDGTYPSYVSADYVLFSSSGIDLITIHRSDSQFQKHCKDSTLPCHVYLAVYAYGGDSMFSVTVHHENEITILPVGQPVFGNVRYGQYEYYAVPVSTGGLDLKAYVTSISGDPDLYMSCTSRTPNASLSTWSSLNYGDVSLTIHPDDKKACKPPTTYYLGVSNGFSGSATFTVSFEIGNHSMTLLDGVPQIGHADGHNAAFFSINTPYQWFPPIEFDIIATPLGGSVALYVNDKVDPQTGKPIFPRLFCNDTTPIGPSGQCFRWAVDPSTYRYTSFKAFENTVVHVPFANSGTPLGIAVVNQLSQPTDFLVAAISSNVASVLQNGITQRGHAIYLHYRYYAFDVSDASKDISISVQTIYGSVEVFASMTKEQPTAASYTWRSPPELNTHAMVIPASSFPKSCVDKVNGGDVCRLHLGVLGETIGNSSYMITATTLGQNSYTTLSNGLMVAGYVNATQYSYFQARVDTDGSQVLSVVLRSFDSGDADLFVNIGKDTFPTSAKSDKKSTSANGVDLVTFSPSEDLYCNNCVINIAVKGFRETVFGITYFTGDAVNELSSGVPADGFVQAGNYTYYSIAVTQPDEDLRIQLTSVSGEADLVVGLYDEAHPEERPTMQNAIWKSTSWLGDDIHVTHTDAHYKSPALYIIGVYGRQPSQYIMVAVAAASQIIDLTTNAVQENSLNPTGATGPVCKYYRYQWGIAGQTMPDLVLTVETLYGDVETFSTNAYDGRDSTLPNPLNTNPCLSYPYFYDTGSTILSPSTLPAGCTSNQNLTWVFGVCSPSSQRYSSAFRISVRHDHAPIVLSEGIPSTSVSIASNETQFFYYNVYDISKDVVVTLTAESGDPDLLASFLYDDPNCYTSPRNYVPICDHYTWKSSKFGDDALNISHVDPNFAKRPGQNLALGVYGFTASVFSILVTQPSVDVSPIITILDGQPLILTTAPSTICPTRAADGSCAGDASTWKVKSAAFLTFTVPANQYRGDAFLQFARLCGNVTGLCGPNLQVYVRGCPSGTCTGADQYPSEFGADINTEVSDITAALHLQRDGCYSADPTSDCTFFIGVYALCPKLGCTNARFEITYSTPTSLDVIPEECLAGGALCVQPTVSYDSKSSAQRTYELFVGNYHNHVTVMAEACTGHAMVAACFGHSKCKPVTKPSISNHDVISGESALTGIAQANFTTSGAVYATVIDAIPGQEAHSYRLSVGVGNVAILQLMHQKPTTSFAITSGLKISWTAAMGVFTQPTTSSLIVNDGKLRIPPPSGPPFSVPGVQYTVYTIPSNLLTASEHMETPCGAQAAYAAATHRANLAVAEFLSKGRADLAETVPKPIASTTSSTSLSLGKDKVALKTQYTITVVASCSETCPSTVREQFAASHPIQVVTAAAGGGGGGGGGGLGGGAIAGIIIAILVVFAIAGFAFWKWRSNKSSVPSGYYTAESTYAPL